MKAQYVNENVNFNRGIGPKAALKLGKRYIIEIPNGEEMEGPHENKKEAKRLLAQLEDIIMEIDFDLDPFDSVDVNIDAKDEAVEEYVPLFNKLGFEYIEED